MNGKSFFNAVLYGAAATLGSIVVTKGVRVLSDPVKKAKLKKNFKAIKDTFAEKIES